MNGIYYQKIVGRWDMRHRLTEKSLLYGDLVTTLRPELLCLMWLPLFMFLLVSHLSQLTNFLTENIKIQHIITTGHSRSDYTFHILYIHFYVKFFNGVIANFLKRLSSLPKILNYNGYWLLCKQLLMVWNCISFSRNKPIKHDWAS